MIFAPTPLEALALGWSIIPINAWKRPLVKWKHLQERQPTPGEVETWEYLPHLRAWALITGAISHQISLDFDGPEGTHLMRKWGVRPVRQTPSMGFHSAHKHPGFPIKTLSFRDQKEFNQRWPGLDIRGDGGYVAFNGQVFIKGSNPSRMSYYKWLRDPAELPDPFEQLPAELQEFLKQTKPENEHTSEPIPTNPYEPRDSQIVPPVSTALLVHMALGRIRDGEHRNSAGFWLATQLRDNGYSKDHTMTLNFVERCPKTNTQGKEASYTKEEWRRTVESAYSQKPRKPWGTK